MKIRILGSGGGEGFPAPFCSCEHCEDARKKGGKSLRTLSQSIIADTCTRFVVTHITHNKSEYHEKVEEIFKGTGISVAYDGFETEI